MHFSLGIHVFNFGVCNFGAFSNWCVYFWHPQKHMMFSFRTIHATKNADLLGVRNNMFLGNTMSFCIVVFSDVSTQSLTWKFYLTSYRWCIAISLRFLSFVVCDLLTVGDYYTYHCMNYLYAMEERNLMFSPCNLQFSLNHHHDWPRDRYIVGWDSFFYFLFRWFQLMWEDCCMLYNIYGHQLKVCIKTERQRQSSFCTLYVFIETY